MNHKFKIRCYNASELLVDCNNLSTFIRRVVKQSNCNYGKGWTPEEYSGMAFEALVEVLICASPIDKRINIKNYEIADVKKHGRDMGIDGYGKSHSGNNHTVQIKFRSNTSKDLTTKDDISNFVANTSTHPDYTNADMTLFTTAKGLNHAISENMYHQRVRTIGYVEISKLIDNNTAFWDLFKLEMGIQED